MAPFRFSAVRFGSARAKRQLGATLIEALIAMVIVGLGLLGALQLQLQGLRLGQDSNFSSVAATRASEIMDAIAYGGQPDTAWTLSLSSQQSGNAVVSAWIVQLQKSLPQGQGSISCVSSICTVQVQWTVAGEAASSATYTVKNLSSS